MPELVDVEEEEKEEQPAASTEEATPAEEVSADADRNP